ncbi:double-strand break repair protein AddB [Paradevosia shaoguanensis]|uniref:double-strand break repair protein AddB n=1 Tax=Paradevosia shaoguanensis TaxID=1335043 RepID=UPI003C73A7D7
MSRPKVYSIAPDAPFLPTLADRILDGTLLGDWPRGDENPFWLSDITVVLPTRRAQLALARAFSERGHVLMPDIRTFGGEAPDEEPFLPPIEAEPLLPGVSRLERRLVLARLIEGWARTPAGAQALSTPPSAAEVLALADSLAQVVDDLNTEQVSAAALAAIAPENLAANWQNVLEFLNLALVAWPAILAERGKADGSALRNERLKRQAETAPLVFGDRPVIAAGSTGSIPATANLLGALSRLPRGALVLPGLDPDLDYPRLLKPEESPHGHPQYGLAQLLRRLGVPPDAVVELGAPGPRVAVIRQALALPEGTARWAQARAALAPQLAEATDGITILGARTADEEARAIALAARDGLMHGKTIGIVSPDRNLARRIAAELLRFDLEVDDAAGSPLFHAPAGRLVRQILSLAGNAFAPVDLVALLRNRSVVLGMERAEVARLADYLETRLLRGQRPAPGLVGVRRLAAEREGAEKLDPLFDALQQALDPLCTLLAGDRFSSATFARTLAEAFARIATGDTVPGRSELEAWANELAGREGEGPLLPATGLEQVLYKLMAGFEVRNSQPRRDDISIWGQLEARLQSPDLLILAGVNEDIWPEPADPGPWLSRGMRMAAGLEPPERKQGLASHDFEMALGNHDVIVAYADRIGTSPALPSRLLQRLEAFVGKQTSVLRARGDVWLEAARSLDAVVGARGADRPMPRPPAHLRPRRLSVTEIETLFRSPYDLYAKHVLRLRRLDPLGEEPGARERGSMIHEVFARFVIEGHDFDGPEALGKLNAMAREAFAGLDAIAERRDIWLRRFEHAAAAFLEFERDRSIHVRKRNAEIKGEWVFPQLDDFRLVGIADRLDMLNNGELEIIDFKTGSIPAVGDMKNFDAPQLLLEAAMAGAGAFEGLPPVAAGALTYVKIALGPDAFRPTEFKPGEGFSLMGAADEVSRRMQRHVTEFLLRDTLPMAARIRPDVTLRYRGTYDHLARNEEWTLLEGDEE